MKVIITGSTGMVGKAILIECLENENIKNVLLINRTPIDLKHQKIREVLVDSFKEIPSIKDELNGYDACFHCMGITSVGKSENEYNEVTFNDTKRLVDTLYKLNSAIVFNYVSGKGTDSSEKGKVMWARVKGKTENYILNKGFKDAYMFRPGIIIPEKGVKSKTKWYNTVYWLLKPFYFLLKKIKSVVPSTNMGLAMINTLLKPQNKKVLESHDINAFAK